VESASQRVISSLVSFVTTGDGRGGTGGRNLKVSMRITKLNQGSAFTEGKQSRASAEKSLLDSKQVIALPGPVCPKQSVAYASTRDAIWYSPIVVAVRLVVGRVQARA